MVPQAWTPPSGHEAVHRDPEVALAAVELELRSADGAQRHGTAALECEAPLA